MQPASQNVQRLLLLLLLLAGGVLRFHGITSRGLVEWDEGHYMLEAQFVRSVLEQAPNLVAGREGLQSLQQRIVGWPLVSAKPGHAFLIFLTSLGTGMRDYAGAVMSAVLGLMTVLVVYAVGAQCGGRLAGLLGAAVLSVSSFHVMYSRSSLAEVGPAFFFLLGVWLLHSNVLAERASWWRLAGGGAALGWALVSNYRWYVVAAALAVACAAWAALVPKRAERLTVLARLGTFWMAALLPAIACEIPYAVARWVGLGSSYPMSMGYWESLKWFYLVKPSQGTFSPHVLYFRTLLQLERPLVAGLVMLGVIAAARRLRDLNVLTVLVPFAVPLALFSMTTRGDRLVAISLVAPFLSILAGMGAAWLLTYVPDRYCSTVHAGLVALILLVGVGNSLWLLQVKSGWRDVSDFVAGRNAKLLTFQAAIPKFYLGREMVKLPPATREELVRAVDGGYRYLALDWKKHHDKNYTPLIREIESDCGPVLSIQQRVRYFPIFLDDFHYPHAGSHLSQEAGLYERLLQDPQGDRILVYDLEVYLGGRCRRAARLAESR